MDLWEIYSGRQDTDAVVIRLLERKLVEKEQEEARTRSQLSSLEHELNHMGLRFSYSYSDQKITLQREFESLTVNENGWTTVKKQEAQDG